MTRFWRPVQPQPSSFRVIACVADDEQLFVLVQGPGPGSIPAELEQIQTVSVINVSTPSGYNSMGSSGGAGGDERRFTWTFTMDAPPEPSEPMTVTLYEDRRQLTWDVQVEPV